METLTQRLLNDFQRDFPLSPRPFDQIARSLDTDSSTVLARLRVLQRQGAVSRVGPVFRPNTVGVSTLAAIAAAEADLERIGTLVSAFPEVNHNYEREHRYNLWFVCTAADQPALARTLGLIGETTGHAVLTLPLVRAFHIDLAFDMRTGAKSVSPQPLGDGPIRERVRERRAGEPAGSGDLIERVQDGLPLVSRPYRDVATSLGWSERNVIRELRRMIDAGIIRRLGVVVRHRELGYRANAMVVWDVPVRRIDELGRRLSREPRVTLCYQRRRRPPDWPYNLFCMVHGRDRDEVRACVDDMTARLEMGDIRHAVLFSGRRFKQRGASYRITH
jgi:DNA-binding Lrp family transcriptional regulator